MSLRPRQSGFNPRAHAGRDMAIWGKEDDEMVFQSTRPRGARLGLFSLPVRLISFQSTRPRGARRFNNCSLKRLQLVSIHAPTRGATGNRDAFSRLGLCFNPRAHGGRDVSSNRTGFCVGCFNPRAHAGRDLPVPGPMQLHHQFQSTRPRGARLNALML